MKIKTVVSRRLISLPNYANKGIELVAELEPGDNAAECYVRLDRTAKKLLETPEEESLSEIADELRKLANKLQDDIPF